MNLSTNSTIIVARRAVVRIVVAAQPPIISGVARGAMPPPKLFVNFCNEFMLLRSLNV